MRSSFPLIVALLLAAASLARGAPSPDYATPRFTDPGRAERLRAILPEIDALFTDFAAAKPSPGVAWGVILDGDLLHTGATGFINVERKIPVSAHDSVFRIASMTKSVTALAIVRLRDAGKLSLDDAVTKYLPDFRHVTPLTRDAPPVTIRHLLTMTAGFPEDNPWGDRQLAVSIEQLRAFLRGDLALSNPAGVTFEYSNLGYALLGQTIDAVAGEPYQRYITREILHPLGLRQTVWDYTAVPSDHLALGYRRENNAWQLEPLLGDGTYGAMGGLLTTLPDFARYIALHMDAYPARNDAETGPLRRASLREMHQPAIISSFQANARTPSGALNPLVAGYGFGLRWSLDSQRVVNVGHSGGLPGFGSHYAFYPDHGFAIVSFANVTYAGTGATNYKAAALVLEKAKLPPRAIPASPVLQTRKEQVAALIQSWDATLAAGIVAENFFPDRSREAWATLSRETFGRLGAVRSVGEIVPENQLRGTFPIHGERGRIDVYFTLTPEKSARLQQLRLTFVPAR